ncbi:protein of unknown function (plasmid) [Shinella sp. WSC3-e]|nr:protein of unknown function [Shinella sp. WSC3-e]
MPTYPLLIEAQCEQCLLDEGKIRSVCVLLTLCADQVFVGKIANDSLDPTAELPKRFDAPMSKGELVLPLQFGMGAHQNRDDLFGSLKPFAQFDELRIGKGIESIFHERAMNNLRFKLDNRLAGFKLHPQGLRLIRFGRKIGDSLIH